MYIFQLNNVLVILHFASPAHNNLKQIKHILTHWDRDIVKYIFLNENLLKHVLARGLIDSLIRP